MFMTKFSGGFLYAERASSYSYYFRIYLTFTQDKRGGKILLNTDLTCPD